MTAVARQRFDKAGFFDWLATQDRRYELVDGHPVMLPNVARNHRRVCINLIAALVARVDPERYEVSHGDFAVETGERTIRYADVMVEPAGGAGRERSTGRAMLLVEVLSPPSEQMDFREKLAEYTNLSACRCYLIFDPDTPRAWQWERVSDGLWPEKPTVVDDPNGALHVREPLCSIPMSEIYRHVT